MGKKLIITEKPSVARDFARVLGVDGRKNGYIESDSNQYVISWCFGHLVEMVYPEEYDEKYASWRLEDLPFLPENYKYGVIKNSADQYAIVHGLLHRPDIDTVYWAGDSGKEGQTIEENIRNFGGVRPGMEELRVWIDSQTDEEILRGINEARPMSDYDLLGRSGIMRTIEDYSLGINFSRALSLKYGRLINDAAATSSYSAIAIGRVMTCVLGMVVKREREIRDFVETAFYKISGSFSEVGFDAEWKSVEGSKYKDSPKLYKENGFKNKEDAEQLISELTGKTAFVKNVENGTSKKKAPLLFNLAELQSECSKIFKISPSEALAVVQDLYERKYTTYPRTDARVLTKAVAKEITKNINGLKRYDVVSSYATEILEGKKYVGLEKTSYVDDSKVTDHYAIIPTGQTAGLDKLDRLHKGVYDLIAKRFLSIFYPPAEYATMKIELQVESEHFFTSAKVLKNPGYMVVSGIPQNKETEDSSDGGNVISKDDLLKLSESLRVGEQILVNGYAIKEGKTSPPKRYTSGNLILAMENAGNLIEDEELREQIKNTGIGTSATRGDILEKLVRIKYLNQNSKTQIITPEKLGEMIYEVVALTVPSLLNPEMTASWEKGLEGIINGSVDDGEYRRKLEHFIREETNKMINNNLSSQIAIKINPFTSKDSRGMAARKPLDLRCPVCGGELTTTSFGYGCSNYFNEEKNCKFSIGQIAGVSLSEEDFKSLITEGKTKVIDGFVAKNKKKFKAALVLKKNEDDAYRVEFDFEGVGPDYLEGAVCPDCGKRIQIRSGSYGCEGYDSSNPDSCRFYIGTICQKQLTAEQVLTLLSQGKTDTIKGFKSKSGKKFDACLALKKNEQGRTEIAFDFENVEPEYLEGVVCPDCGKRIQKKAGNFGCEGYDSTNPESCRFFIGKIAQKQIPEAQVIELLKNGKTKTIRGFKGKTSKKFDACLSLKKNENGRSEIVFDFEDVEARVIKDAKCPICGGDIVKTSFGYGCKNYDKSRPDDSCRFNIGTVAGVTLTEAQVKELLEKKITEPITGFKAKNGNLFTARLAIKPDEDGKITGIKFVFDN